MARNLAVLLVSTLLSLAAAEVAIRVGLVPLPGFIVSDGWWKERWLRTGRGGNPREFVALDPDLGWVVAAGLDGIAYQGVRISTNSAHMRGRREFPLGRTGAARVAVVGDSYAFGQCVEDDETFPAVMEERLPDTEVMNLGVMGYGQDQALLRMRRDALRYRPDVVVFGFHGTDMRRNVLRFRDYAKPRFRLGDDGLRLENVPVPGPEAFRGPWPPRLWNYVLMGRDRMAVERREGREEINRLSRAIVHRMAQEARDAGTRLAVVYLPRVGNLDREGRYGWGWFERLCEGEKPAPFLCVDPTPRFRELLPTREAVREHFACHYSPLLYRAVGEETAQALLRAFPEVFAGSGTPGRPRGRRDQRL
jgi:hypothetical protein